MKVEFKNATREDAANLLARGVRKADLLEAARLGFPNIEDALDDSIAFSDFPIAAYTPHGVACIFGISRQSRLSQVGTIWLIAHPDIERYAVRFLKDSRKMLAKLLEYYPRVENIVDVENTLTIRWLEWLGFTVDKSKTVRSLTGFPFYRFWKEA